MTQYKWLEGSNRGVVETLKTTQTINGVNYLVFESGRQAEVTSIGFMVEEVGSDATHSKGNDMNLGKASLIPHPNSGEVVEQEPIPDFAAPIPTMTDKSTLKEHGIDITEGIEPSKFKPEKRVIKAVVSPIEELIKKSIKEVKDVDISLEIELPSKEFLKIIFATFPDDHENIKEIIVKQIDKDEIHKQLADFFEQYIK